MDWPRLIEAVSDAFSCTWDVGTAPNRALADRLTTLAPSLAGLSDDTTRQVLALVIEDVLHLDVDEAGHTRVYTLIALAQAWSP